jgi:hypothetical protein
MQKFGKYFLAFLIGYWVCRVGGPLPAIHDISVFLGSIGH